MINVRLKLSNSDFWPPEYLGKEVTVRIGQLIFPNGTVWHVDSEPYEAEVLPEKDSIQLIHQPATLAGLVGAKQFELKVFE